MLDRISKRYTIDLQERPLPSDEDVARIVAERITALLEARLRSRDKLQVERMQRFLGQARSMGESEEPDLMAMLLDDFYQEAFHGLIVPPAGGEAPKRAAHSSGGSKRPDANRDGGRRGGRPRR